MGTGTDYTDFEIYKQAMRAYGDKDFAVWCCETFPWGAFDMERERVVYLTRDLAAFSQYPPERMSPGEEDRNCFACGTELGSIAYAVLGGRDGAVWSVFLCPRCKGIAENAQQTGKKLP